MSPINRGYPQDFPPEYYKYSVLYKGKLEKIGFTLWDTVTYVSGASVELPMFNAVRATKDLGNLQTPNALPGQFAMLVRSLRFHVKQEPRSTAKAAATNVQTGGLDNIALLTNTGVLRIKISTKDYCEYPLWMLCAGGGPFGGIAAEGATADPGAVADWGVNGIPDPRAVFTLSTPLFIPPLITFDIRLVWAAFVTLAGGNTPVCVALDGDALRPVQ